jgi:hypothetical protein
MFDDSFYLKNNTIKEILKYDLQFYYDLIYHYFFKYDL